MSVFGGWEYVCSIGSSNELKDLNAGRKIKKSLSPVFLFSRSEKWSPERQSNLPEVIQQMAEVGFRLSISFFSHTCYCLVAKLHLTLLRPHGLPDSSDPGISQARILEWVVISFSRGSSQPRDQTFISCIGRRILYHWATREALCTY